MRWRCRCTFLVQLLLCSEDVQHCRSHFQNQVSNIMPKKVKNITNRTDYDELSKAYKFVLEDDKDAEDGKNKASTWQDRMVIKYHEYLYKSHVIADLSRFEKGGLGLRWR